MILVSGWKMSARWIACVAMAFSLVPASASAEDWVLRMNGIGPLKIGMTFDQANRATGFSLQRSADNLRPTEGCDFIPIAHHPGIGLMFIDDRLVRAEVFAGSSRTQREVGVGTSVKAVLSLYPGIRIEPNAYDENEQYLTMTSSDGSLAIRFETGAGKISSVYAGQSQPVHYTEHCL